MAIYTKITSNDIDDCFKLSDIFVLFLPEVIKKSEEIVNALHVRINITGTCILIVEYI